MMIRGLRFIMAGLSLLALPTPAFAWWEYGHETVAKIAMETVRPATRQSIRWLLQRQKALETPTCPVRTIEEASVWPDCIKGLGDRFSYQSSWHYQDPDICAAFDLKPFCKDGNCVSAQIARAQRMVADRALPTRDRLMALAYLVHFVGDLHQPLHGGEYEGDAGGNGTKMRYGAIPRTNLHSVWDGLLAERAISTPVAGADGILAAVAPADRARLAAGTITDWSRESWEIARIAAYGSVIPNACAARPGKSGGKPDRPSGIMDEATVQALIPVVRLQVARGGLRLARLLDEALDGNHPEVAHPPRPKKTAG